MEFYDRVPTYPGRVRLVPVPGQANTYDMVRADEPTVEGTPVNKALFDGINDHITAVQKTLADTLFAITQRVEVGALSPGAVFGLYENGVLVPYIKLVNGYANSDRVLVVRKDCIKESRLYTPGSGGYTNSEIDLWLNNEFISIFDTTTQNVIDAVNIEVDSGSSISKISRKAFLLALYGYNMTADSLDTPRPIGESISYFATADRRIATFNGTPVNHWTRTTDVSFSAYITTDGGYSIARASEVIAGIRPALTLPTTFEVTAGMPSTANTMATAEVIE